MSILNNFQIMAIIEKNFSGLPIPQKATSFRFFNIGVILGQNSPSIRFLLCSLKNSS